MPVKTNWRKIEALEGQSLRNSRWGRPCSWIRTRSRVVAERTFRATMTTSMSLLSVLASYLITGLKSPPLSARARIFFCPRGLSKNTSRRFFVFFPSLGSQTCSCQSQCGFQISWHSSAQVPFQDHEPPVYHGTISQNSCPAQAKPTHQHFRRWA